MAVSVVPVVGVLMVCDPGLEPPNPWKLPQTALTWPEVYIVTALELRKAAQIAPSSCCVPEIYSVSSPEGPSTEYLRFLISKTMPTTVRNLKYCVPGPSGRRHELKFAQPFAGCIWPHCGLHAMQDPNPWAAFEILQGPAQGRGRLRSQVEYGEGGDLLLKPRRSEKPQAKAVCLGCRLPCQQLARFVKKVFFPVDYPHSVAHDYLSFIEYTACQVLCGYMSKVIATEAMLLAVGVGGPGTIPMAAVTAWVLKDGIGHLLAIIMGTLINSRFDSDPKRFRFQAMALAKIADLFCILTLQWPQYFFALSALGGALGRLSMNIGQTSRPKIFETFSRGNLGDLMRCNSAQTTAAELLGTGLGAGLGQLLGAEVHLLACASVLLSVSSLSCCYQATALVQMASLNRQRAELVLEPAVRQICGSQRQKADPNPTEGSLTLPSVEEIRDREVFVLPYESPSYRKVNPALNASYQLLTPPDPTTHHLLGWTRGRLVLWYHVEATPGEVLQGFLQSQLFEALLAKDRKQGNLEELRALGSQAAELGQLWWPVVHAALLAQGWQTEFVFLDARKRRIRIEDAMHV